MEKLKREWIDLLFIRLHEIYGEAYKEAFPGKDREEIAKTMWSCGLSGLTSEQIKKGLALLKQRKERSHPYHASMIPTVVEFYHYAKGLREPPPITPQAVDRGDPIVARAHLDEIKRRLKGKTLGK